MRQGPRNRMEWGGAGMRWEEGGPQLSLAPLIPFGHQMQKEACYLTALSQTPFPGGQSPACLKGPTEVPSSPKRTPPLLSNCVQALVTTHKRRKFILSSNRNLSLLGFFSVALERPGKLGAVALPVVNLRAVSKSYQHKVEQS